MEIRATRSFSGLVTMCAGEVRTVGEELAADLIRAGYAEPVKERPKRAKEG